MSDINGSKIHWSFWVISSVMLVWNVLGCINFIVQLDPEMIASYRESERAIIMGRPLWATLGFAIAVFGGALGCILLLLRNSFAVYLFVVSLPGVVLATGHTLTLDIQFGVGEIIGILFLPNALAGVLIWYSIYVEKRGWLKPGK